MTLLERLKKLNPELKLYSVRDAAFKKYGRLIEDYDSAAICKACREALTMPRSGSVYFPALDALTGTADDLLMTRRFFGQTAAQTGVCYGYNSLFNALEYHRSSEINVAVTPLVLMLGDMRDMNGYDYDAGKVEAFLLEAGDTVEVYATSLHYCPCQVSGEGFISVVGLPRGTNTDLTEKPASEGEDRLLFAANKWIICHENCRELTAQGVYPGIHGLNYELKY